MSTYTVVVEREDDGRYSAYVPDLPGCASMGDTKRVALTNVREAIESYLGALAKIGRAAPAPRAAFERIRVRAA